MYLQNKNLLNKTYIKIYLIEALYNKSTLNKFIKNYKLKNHMVLNKNMKFTAKLKNHNLHNKTYYKRVKNKF